VVGAREASCRSGGPSSAGERSRCRILFRFGRVVEGSESLQNLTAAQQSEPMTPIHLWLSSRSVADSPWPPPVRFRAAMSLAGSIITAQSLRLVYSSTETLSRIAFHSSGAVLAVGELRFAFETDGMFVDRSNPRAGSETKVQVLAISKDEEGKWRLAQEITSWSLFGDVTCICGSQRSTEAYFE
jgi:hypothetical protein